MNVHFIQFVSKHNKIHTTTPYKYAFICKKYEFKKL